MRMLAVALIAMLWAYQDSAEYEAAHSSHALGPSREHYEKIVSGEVGYIIGCTTAQTMVACVCSELPGSKACEKNNAKGHMKLPPQHTSGAR